jgi:para-nitrobenzyl esterase
VLRRAISSGALLVLALGCAQVAPPPSLGGTSWQLAAFRGGDGTVLKPDDGSRYTLGFSTDGVMSARIDCNRARAGWTSPAPGRLEFGPIAATRAACPPGSLHDQIMRQLPFVRSYVIRDGRLYLSLMADGGTYEFVSSPP